MMNSHFQKIIVEMESQLGIDLKVSDNEVLNFHFKGNLCVSMQLHTPQERVSIDAILDNGSDSPWSDPKQFALLLLQFNYVHRGESRPYVAVDPKSRLVLTQSIDLVQLDGMRALRMIEKAVEDARQLSSLIDELSNKNGKAATQDIFNEIPSSITLIKV